MPIYDNFVAPTGEIMSVGRYTSSPAPGKRLNISKNNASDVDYDFQFNGRNVAPFDNWWNGYGFARSFSSDAYAWSGMVHAPDCGPKGSVVLYGGGHGGQQGQFVYIGDYATRLWSQLGAPNNMPPNMAWAGFVTAGSAYNASIDLRDPDWLDYLYNGSYVFMHDHSYNTVNYVTKSEGGGNKGSLLIPSVPKTQNPSDFPSKWAPHLFNLETGIITRAMTAPTGLDLTDDNNTVSVKDTTRSNVWYFKHGSTTAWRQSLTGGPPFGFSAHPINKTNGTLTNTFIACMARPFEYVPEADAIVALFSVESILVFDMSTGVPIDLQRTGMPPYTFDHGGLGVSMAWCPPQQAFYLYEGMGDTFCTVLRPSSLNFATCTWTWSRENFTGDAPVNARGIVLNPTTYHGAYRRFFWNPATNLFEWNDGPDTTGLCLDGQTRDGVMQSWRPPGTVI